MGTFVLRGARVELASLAYETNDLPFVLPAMLPVFPGCQVITVGMDLQSNQCFSDLSLLLANSSLPSLYPSGHVRISITVHEVNRLQFYVTQHSYHRFCCL